MLVFPQLVTGAVGAVSGDAAERAADGGEYAGRREHGGVQRSGRGADDVGDCRRRGSRRRSGTRSRRCSTRCAGQWQTFTLLDPAGNLFANSELLSAGAWTQRSVD